MKSRKKILSRRSKRQLRIKSPRKSKRPRRVKSSKKGNRIKSKRYDGMKKACIKWEKIPPEKREDYEITVKTCRTCGRTSSIPYLVHTEGGDYECYKCGGDVDIRHMCPYCVSKK